MATSRLTHEMIEAGFCEDDLPEEMSVEEAIRRLHALFGKYGRPDQPALTDEQIKEDARAGWLARSATWDL